MRNEQLEHDRQQRVSRLRAQRAQARAAAEQHRAAGRRAEAGARWLDGRLPFLDAGKGLLRKIFPDHWSFLLGELALYSFALLMLTGVYLTFFFKPAMREVVYSGSYAPLRGLRVTEAYASTLTISFDVRGGLLIRQLHHWAALVFLAAIGAHMMRVFFTGAFRRPREMNWLIGLTLFQLALVEGFAGYSLPDDLLSGTGLRTAQGFMLAVPLVGSYLSFFAFGSEWPGQDIIPRLYTTHVLLLPGLMLGLVTAHLILVFYLKHTQWGGPGRSGRNVVGQPMFPQFLAKTGGLAFMVFGLLALLAAVAQVNPIWNYGPYRADQASTDAQPDWYMGFLEGALRLMPGTETQALGHTISWNPLIPAVLFPLVLFMALYAYPFVEQWITGDRSEHHLCDRPRNRPTRTAIGVAGLTAYAVLLLAGAQDIVAYKFDTSVNTLNWTLRIALFVAPFLAFHLTRYLCLALQSRDRTRLTTGTPTGFVHQSVEGAFRQSHDPLTPSQKYTLTLDPPPAPLAPADPSRRERVRAALSDWYYRDRVH
ncbi:ubiquinol-cytochrome c reductase cytochrome b subunit [Streptomyces tateyamensis]|uniref:Cytochrome bc1 complex cytochrome b subunit n=1 Tax=Streptomyces tateyamensis TaxID=565073 RepID=A0A2V4N5M5_9ACTN|nr:cytochrome bc complex cytochrome b subunit [Streptomyces tateyamensis]PYC76836.1 ubiquinol-cytochrome c reductase cytochrome b subunit [Streptomyces tateyamensis]